MFTESAGIERDLAAARAGERLTFIASWPEEFSSPCNNCGLRSARHIRESGILFCAEWALQERWGK